MKSLSYMPGIAPGVRRRLSVVILAAVVAAVTLLSSSCRQSGIARNETLEAQKSVYNN